MKKAHPSWLEQVPLACDAVLDVDQAQHVLLYGRQTGGMTFLWAKRTGKKEGEEFLGI